MAFTITTKNGPVVLKELWADFKKGIDISRGPYVDAVYLAPSWGVTDAVLNTIMGSTAASGGVGGATIRVPGLPCPQSPNLCAIDAYCMGEGEYDVKNGGRPEFNLPKIHVSYGIRTWEQLTNDDPGGLNSFPNDDNPGQPYTFAIQSIDFAGETLKLPESAYKFSSAPQLPLDQPFCVHMAVATMVFERKKVPYLPTKLIFSKLNRINDAVFFGAEPEKVMFMGAKTTKTWESDGTRVQDIQLVFKYREHSWNKLHRPDEQSWDPIVDRNGKRPYVLADLRPLIFQSVDKLNGNVLI